MDDEQVQQPVHPLLPIVEFESAGGNQPGHTSDPRENPSTRKELWPQVALQSRIDVMILIGKEDVRRCGTLMGKAWNSIRTTAQIRLRQFRVRFWAIDHSLRPIATAVETSSIAHLLGILVAGLAVASVPIAVFQLVNELSARNEERIDRAWTRVLMPVGGNTGKGGALQFLIAQGVDLSGLDLSCEAAGTWDETNRKCRTPPIYAGFDLPIENENTATDSGEEPLDEWMFSDPIQSRELDRVQISSLRDSIILKMNAKGAILRSAKIENARIIKSDLSESEIRDSLNGVKIEASDLSKSKVSLTETSLLKLSNVSGMVFSGESRNPWANGLNWAWADAPPLFRHEESVDPAPVEILELMWLCDPTWRFSGDEQIETRLVGLPYKTNAQIGGFLPAVSAGAWPEDGIFLQGSKQVCPIIDWRDAAKIYPDRYPQLPAVR